MEYPMCRYRVFLVLLGLVFVPLTTRAYAQTDEAPLVVFILDERLETASPFSTGASGLSELERIFQNLGARTRNVSLSDPLPQDAHIVVMARPVHSLPTSYVARLWLHMANGKHLLLAIDPWGHNGVYPDPSNSALHRLLMLDYGVSVLDTFIISPSFTSNTIADAATAYSRVYPMTTVTHPILQPLVRYDLPVQIWGARAIEVDTLGLSSFSVPLLRSQSGYGKPSSELFGTESDVPAFELNPDTDLVGQKFVSALAENLRTGSRIAVLGDSEIVQNGFGLAYSVYTAGAPPPPDAYPLHPGNRIFVERLAAWLLELPIADWPPLPSGFTWLELDGVGHEWAEVPLLMNDSDDVDLPQYDIVRVKAFRDASYLYLFIETAAPPEPNTGIMLNLNNRSAGGDTLKILAVEDSVIVFDGEDTGTVIADGDMASGEALEIRLPLRITGEDVVLDNLCLCVACEDVDSEQIDCADGPSGSIPGSINRTPENLPAATGLLVTVATTTNVNLRQEPGTESQSLSIIQNGHMFEAVGRSESGDWILVQDASHVGWIARFLLVPNGDLLNLPVMSAP